MSAALATEIYVPELDWSWNGSTPDAPFSVNVVYDWDAWLLFGFGSFDRQASFETLGLSGSNWKRYPNINTERCWWYFDDYTGGITHKAIYETIIKAYVAAPLIATWSFSGAGNWSPAGPPLMYLRCT
jgi:hypothetical protein